MFRRTPLVALVALWSCGDPRTPFIGTYAGPLTVTVSDSSGSESYPKGEITVVISAPKNSNVLQFDGKCQFTADVVATDKFSINQKACPTERIEVGTSSAPVQCNLTETVNSGVGTLKGDTLTVSWSGDSQLTQCTDGIPYSGQYSSKATVTRK
jgi:hypothetical protein